MKKPSVGRMQPNAAILVLTPKTLIAVVPKIRGKTIPTMSSAVEKILAATWRVLFFSNSEVSANNWTAIRYLNVYQTNVPAPFLNTKRQSFTTYFFFAISLAPCTCIWLNVPAIYIVLFCAKLHRNVQSNAKDRRIVVSHWSMLWVEV